MRNNSVFYLIEWKREALKELGKLKLLTWFSRNLKNYLLQRKKKSEKDKSVRKKSSWSHSY